MLRWLSPRCPVVVHPPGPAGVGEVGHKADAQGRRVHGGGGHWGRAGGRGRGPTAPIPHVVITTVDPRRRAVATLALVWLPACCGDVVAQAGGGGIAIVASASGCSCCSSCCGGGQRREHRARWLVRAAGRRQRQGGQLRLQVLVRKLVEAAHGACVSALLAQHLESKHKQVGSGSHSPAVGRDQGLVRL